MTCQNSHRTILLVVAALIWSATVPVHAQLGESNDKPIQEIQGLDSLPGFGGQVGAAVGESPVKIKAHFSAPSDRGPARLFITAEIRDNFHVYSLNQAAPPQKTKIRVNQSGAFRSVGAFKADVPPKINIMPPDAPVWPNLPLEEHYGKVTWYAPIDFAPGVDLGKLEITGVVDLQACDPTSCVPFLLDFTAKMGPAIDVGPAAATKLVGPTVEREYRAPRSSITIRGHVEPRVVAPGGTARLVLTALPDESWHVYAHQDRDPAEISKPTLIVVEDAADLTAYRAATPSVPIEDDQGVLGIQRYHEGEVTWTLDVVVPAGAAPGSRVLSGIIGYQVCQETTCQPPIAARFQVAITVGEAPAAGEVPLVFAAAKYLDAAQSAEQNPVSPAGPSVQQVTGSGASGTPLAVILGFALLGGLILNLMPCVLPVIGLKVLAFVEQGGQSRARIFGLNLAYVAGLMSVFLILAVLAATITVNLGAGEQHLGWGEQFTVTWFKVAMTALVFVMALSFLGVWDIPIPGFAGSGKATDMAAREGVLGAFFKGVFTTILATPCSGPFLGPVFGYTLGQPPHVTYLLFTFVGLGMASPYLLIGAFPVLVSWLPKPGAWMETFKQLMGFVLLATVVYLFSTLSEEYFLATLSLLVGLWFTCWWIGRTPITASRTSKLTAWLGGSATAAIIGYAAFTLLTPSSDDLTWQEFSPPALAKAQAEGKTVLLEFTADWCLTCKTNMKLAINTEDVRRLVAENDVVPMLADWTERSKIIKDTLAKLGSNSIPLLAVYPAGRPEEVIVLRDLIWESELLEALKKAGPSQGAGQSTSTAMTAP